MLILSYRGVQPQIHVNSLVSSLATVIGDVEILEGASVFPGAVIRGDVAKITVGKYSNIQDNVVLHGGDVYEDDLLVGHLPATIGNYVTVGHGAIVHGSQIDNISLIGIRAIVYGGSRIGEGSIIGMNSMVLRNTIIPERSLVVGSPAKILRTVDEVTYSKLKKHALRYYELAKSHKGNLF